MLVIANTLSFIGGAQMVPWYSGSAVRERRRSLQAAVIEHCFSTIDVNTSIYVSMIFMTTLNAKESLTITVPAVTTPALRTILRCKSWITIGHLETFQLSYMFQSLCKVLIRKSTQSRAEEFRPLPLALEVQLLHREVRIGIVSV
jgi:hypothetical protein